MFPGTVRAYSNTVHAAPAAAPMQPPPAAPPTGGGDALAQTQRAANAQKPPGEGVRRAAYSAPRAPRMLRLNVGARGDEKLPLHVANGDRLVASAHARYHFNH